mgnify:CR=1 FL=1
MGYDMSFPMNIVIGVSTCDKGGYILNIKVSQRRNDLIVEPHTRSRPKGESMGMRIIRCVLRTTN